MQLDTEHYFHTYAALYNRALGGEDVLDEIMGCFTPNFIAAGPKAVTPGARGGAFRELLEQSYDFYRKLGTKRMMVDGTDDTEIDDNHLMTRVSFTAGYETETGGEISIPFQVTYIFQRTSDGPKICAFISEDEMKIYREYGLVPPEGDPPAG